MARLLVLTLTVLQFICAFAASTETSKGWHQFRTELPLPANGASFGNLFPKTVYRVSNLSPEGFYSILGQDILASIGENVGMLSRFVIYFSSKLAGGPYARATVLSKAPSCAAHISTAVQSE
jgi:hypothetical protein